MSEPLTDEELTKRAVLEWLAGLSNHANLNGWSFSEMVEIVEAKATAALKGTAEPWHAPSVLDRVDARRDADNPAKPAGIKNSPDADLDRLDAESGNTLGGDLWRIAREALECLELDGGSNLNLALRGRLRNAIAAIEKRWCDEPDAAEQAGVSPDVEAVLVLLYKDAPCTVAMLCDSELDKSGALLGRVRAAAEPAGKPEAKP